MPQEMRLKVWPNPFSLENQPSHTPLHLLHFFTGIKIKLMHTVAKDQFKYCCIPHSVVYFMRLPCGSDSSLNCMQWSNNKTWITSATLDL